MRKADLKENPLDVEKKVEARKRHRKSGYVLMKDRDEGSVTLSNGVRMCWSVIKPEFPDKGGPYVYPRMIPENHVELDGVLYSAEELRQYLRWA